MTSMPPARHSTGMKLWNEQLAPRRDFDGKVERMSAKITIYVQFIQHSTKYLITMSNGSSHCIYKALYSISQVVSAVIRLAGRRWSSLTGFLVCVTKTWHISFLSAVTNQPSDDFAAFSRSDRVSGHLYPMAIEAYLGCCHVANLPGSAGREWEFEPGTLVLGYAVQRMYDIADRKTFNKFEKKTETRMK